MPFCVRSGVGGGLPAQAGETRKNVQNAPILPRSAAGPPGRCESEAFGRISRRRAMTAVALTVNGKAVTGDVDPRTLLVQSLPENLRLTVTPLGSDPSHSGPCVPP